MSRTVWSADRGWHESDADVGVVWVRVRHGGRERDMWLSSASDWRDVFAYRFGYRPADDQLVGGV
jgi:hypothetical protein